MNLPWEPSSANGRVSNTPTPDFTLQCSSSTPVIRSPYAGRKGISDDGDSSVYSVDTDGYYTSMHTDSGLWCNAVTTMKFEDGAVDATNGFRQRQESQSSVSTLGNSSINSFLSKSATECSSNSGSFKRVRPEPPPRVSSSKVCKQENKFDDFKNDQDMEDSDKSSSPQLQNGSTSESDHEVGDRIRAKTTITANRYPSMCAVSPETSDDEVSDSKHKIVPNINVIVAEVHREEKAGDSPDAVEATDLVIKGKRDGNPSSPCSVNMYRSQTPLPSNFSSALCQNNNPLATSTPRSGINITTFSPDFNEIRNNKGGSYSRFKEIDSNFESDEELIVTESPIRPQSDNDKCLIPLKYAQCITVTPVARSDSFSTLTGTIKRTPVKSYNSNSNIKSPGQDQPFVIPYNKKDSQPSYISFQAPDSPVSSIPSLGKIPSISDKNLSSPTNSLPRSVARVTLDPSGKVVYSSNSLERIGNLNMNRNTVERTYATLPLCQMQTEMRVITPLKQMSGSYKVDSVASIKSDEKENSTVSQAVISKSDYPVITKSTPFMHNQNIQTSKPTTAVKHDFTFRPSRGGRFCRSYFPSHLISPQPASARTENSFPRVSCTVTPPEHSSNNTNHHLSKNPAWQSHPVSSCQIPESLNHCMTYNKPVYPSPTVPNTTSDNFSNSRLNSPPSSPNIWPGRLYNLQEKKDCTPARLKPQTNNSYSSDTSADINMNKSSTQSTFVTLRPPDLIPSGSSPPSTLDITSPAGSHRRASPTSSENKDHCKMSPDCDQKSLKALSPSELFAIIHSSKKKHNIKTESEVSMSPMSSRSVSPALSQTSISKIQPVETGILSKRSDPLSPDKTKWYNSMPSSMRKTTANDKLGPTKPTSMHDFKMLLLQTRTGVNDTNPRPSAAELLKVSPTKISPTNSKPPMSSMFKSPISHFTSNPSYSPGHGTVPIKRNMRTRSPYLTRYDSAYPPIMEDCSEETESSYEDSKCLTTNPSFNQNPMYKLQDAVPQSTSVVKATSTWV